MIVVERGLIGYGPPFPEIERGMLHERCRRYLKFGAVRRQISDTTDRVCSLWQLRDVNRATGKDSTGSFPDSTKERESA